MAELKHVLKEIEFHQNYVGEGFLKLPEGNFNRVNIFGDISKAEEFTEENLYLFYEFDLPLGWKVDNENEYYMIYKSENIIEENINKLKSVSQTSRYYCDTEGDGHFIHNFCLPFELELLAHETIYSSFTPKLLMRLNSIDSYGRHRIEGYAFVQVPSQPGSYKFTIPCYKPIEDNYMRVFSFFLGGSRKIPDLKEIAKTSTKDEMNMESILNRYGIQSEYSGKITINLNVAVQTKELSIETKRRVKENFTRELYNLKTTIENLTDDKNEEHFYETFDDREMIQSKFGFLNVFSK